MSDSRHTPTADSTGTESDSKNLSVRLDGEKSLKLKALAYDYGNCSQSAVIREYIAEHYDQVFGDLDPDALDRGVIPDDQLREIINGADAEQVVDDEYLISSDDDTEAAPAAASDGGTMVAPGSYSMTLGPSELAQSGPELTWDKLRDVVADDGHWSDELVIHPDRVPADELKSSHKYTPRIVAAVLRHKAVDGGFVPGSYVDETIDEYLLGLHDRVDEREGRQYIYSTYRPLIVEHLFEAPNPRVEAYYTTLEGQIQAAEDIIDMGIELPDGFENGDAVMDRQRWHTTNGYEEATKQTVGEWIKDVAELLESVAQIKYATTRVEAFDEVAVAYPDAYDSKVSFLKAMWTTWSDKFDTEVEGKHRKGVIQEMDAETVGILDLN